MTPRVRVIGAGRLARRLGRERVRRRHALELAAMAGAERLRDEARRLLGRAALAGVPSAPGEPPRQRSGALADSVTVWPVADRPAAEVGSDLAYGRHLEFGTRRMAARPWLWPAFQAVKAGLRRRFLEAARGRPAP